MSTTLEERSSEGRVGPADDRPLTEQEQQLVRRLLSDPFVFPIQFKTWLISYLESSDVSLPMGAVSGLKSILGVAGVGGGVLGVLPAGIILPYGGAVAPSGSLLCDGASYLRTSYSRLFEAIGTRYGSVDVNHFNVPNLQKRVAVGLDATDVDFNTLGKTGGAKLHVLSYSEMPPHVHGGFVAAVPAPGSGSVGYSGGDRGMTDQTSSAGGGVGHNNMQPYLVINNIIVA